jgi:DNA polymerase alpha subunit B
VLTEEDNDGKVVGEHSASYEMVFVEKVIRDGVNAIFQAAADSGEDLPTNVVMIPSLLDGHHECVYPQPPFGDRQPLDTPYFEEPLGVLNIKHSKEMDADKRVHLLPNPCMFRLNEVLFGATSNDVLFNLSQDKVMEKTGGALERNAGHLLQQHSFSPQFPAPPKALAQMDLRHMPEWTMKQSPDVLLLPSKLGANGYISTVLDTLIVNPGTLVKGQSGGGTYAEMHIHPLKKEELLEAVKSAETEVKLEGSGSGSGSGGGLMKHGVAKRTHTKVIKI